MSDRVMIIKDGKLSGTFERNAELSEADLIHYII